MNMQWMSVIRDVLKIGGTFLATWGVVDSGTWETVSGALITLVGFIWTRFASSPKAVVAEASREVPVPTSSQLQVGITQPVQPTR